MTARSSARSLPVLGPVRGAWHQLRSFVSRLTPPTPYPRVVIGYVMAVLAPLVVSAALLPVRDEAGPALTALAFPIAILVASWIGGIGPGAAAAVLAFGLYNYFFTQPYRQLGIQQPGYQIAISIVFLGLAAAMSAVAATAHRRATDRRVATLFRTSLIPPQLPSVPGLELAVLDEEPQTVGGDFVDIFKVKAGFAIVYGDIAGKGPEAGSWGLMAKYLLRGLAFHDPSPSSVAHLLNRALCESFSEEKFLTLVYSLYQPETRRLLTCNCGSWPLLVVRDGSVEAVPVSGGLLGAFEEWEYPRVDLTLAPGDLVVGYTDGVPEASRGGERFGIDRLLQVVERHARNDVSAFVRLVMNDVREFAGGDIRDDAVVIAARSR